jgi:hypothetical protein
LFLIFVFALVVFAAQVDNFDFVVVFVGSRGVFGRGSLFGRVFGV